MLPVHLPTDCALLIGIPLTKQEFLNESQPCSRLDYARSFREQLTGLSDSDLWARYESVVVEPAVSAMDFARASGVLVTARTSLDAWKAAVSSRTVVSLVAHWHPAGFTASIIQRIPGLVDDVRQSQGAAAQRLAQALCTETSVTLDQPQVLADVLNASLRHSLVVPEEWEEGVTWVANDQEQVLHRNFESVATEFSQWQLTPPGMELSDGIHSANDIVSRVPDQCTATFDLRMCHSVILGEALKRAAPLSRIVMNARLVRPSVQLPLYKGVLMLLETGRYDFSGAVAKLHTEVVRRLT